MDKRTTGTIATLITVVLCGCPGLIALCTGAMFALISIIPGSNIDINGSSDPKDALTLGLVMLCVGILFVLIPTIVAFVTLRKKKGTIPAKFNEPIPPAS
jgi:hypothetical protein